MKKYKEIITVCLPCGQAIDKKHKTTMGCWMDTCDICGEKNVPCADAAHDFGIYSNKEIKIKDKIQDLI